MGNIAVATMTGEAKRIECNMEELILDARMDKNGNLDDKDVKEPQNHGEKMARMKNKSSELMYKHYQNLWHDYARQKNK